MEPCDTLRYSLVVAADAHNGIGRAGALPWRLPGEMAYFKRLTSAAAAGRQNAVIMGRKTYESIAPKYRPLAGRLNLVLSRDPAYEPGGALRAGSLDDALARASEHAELAELFVIGGGELFALALRDPRCVSVHLTRVHAVFDCDTFLPELAPSYRLTASEGPHAEGATSYTFERHERVA